MKNECSVVSDLLPLYAEGLTSPETADFVREHISSCASCREALAAYSAPPTEEAPARDEALPLKTVKRRITRKWVLIAVLSLAASFALVIGAALLFLFRYPSHVKTETGESALYTEEEILSAAQTVTEDFKAYRGCRLYSLAYAGDETAAEELDYINEFGDYDECLVFRSVFRSPIFGGGAWSGGLYYWSWYLGRSEGGEWTVVQRGYP